VPIDPTIVRDVVIVVPGIMGTELIDQDNKPIWSVNPGALARAIRTFGGSVTNLALPRDHGDAPAPPGVKPGRLIKSLHVIPGVWSPITGYDGIMNFLRSDRFHLVDPVKGDPGVMPNLLEFPYDWRLSNRYNALLLKEMATKALEAWRTQPGMKDAKLVLVCHSMGGLIARWFAEKEKGSEIIRTIITIGTPFRGSVRALSALANPLEPGVGPFHVSLTAFARSLPSLYQLLPQYDCIVGGPTRRSLRDIPHPALNTTLLKDAFEFHNSIAPAHEPSYTLHKVAGIRQPTPTTAAIEQDRVTVLTTIDDRDQGGDGTVPRLAAEPVVGRGRDVHEIVEQHGELQGTQALLDLLDGILSREEIIWQHAASRAPFGVEMKDVWATAEAPWLRVTEMNNRALTATVLDEVGAQIGLERSIGPDAELDLGPLKEGGYRVVISSALPGAAPTVSKPIVVLGA
jgi:pimeloyl-ACP methyl ester carboxylesterase